MSVFSHKCVFIAYTEKNFFMAETRKNSREKDVELPSFRQLGLIYVTLDANH